MSGSVVGVEVIGLIVEEDANGCVIEIRVAAVLADGRRIAENPELVSRGISIITAVGSSAPYLPIDAQLLKQHRDAGVETTFANQAAEGDLGFYPLAESLQCEGLHMEQELLRGLPRSYVLQR